jgi:hypothetical protein
MNYSATEELGFEIWDFLSPPFYRGDEEKSTPSWATLGAIAFVRELAPTVILSDRRERRISPSCEEEIPRYARNDGNAVALRVLQQCLGEGELLWYDLHRVR